MSLDMLGSSVVSSGMAGLPTSMQDCVSSPHGIHPSMSMYQVMWIVEVDWLSSHNSSGSVPQVKEIWT